MKESISFHSVFSSPIVSHSGSSSFHSFSQTSIWINRSQFFFLIFKFVSLDERLSEILRSHVSFLLRSFRPRSLYHYFRRYFLNWSREEYVFYKIIEIILLSQILRHRLIGSLSLSKRFLPLWSNEFEKLTFSRVVNEVIRLMFFKISFRILTQDFCRHIMQS